MNEKITNQIAEMKKQTIGVEVEMNNITREKAARIAAKFFGTGRYENTAGRNGYYTWSAWDEQGREWKFQRDVSIAGCDSEKCELVTPILTYADMETLQELIRQLRHLHFQEWMESQPSARIVALERHWRVWGLKLRNRRKYWIRFISILCKKVTHFSIINLLLCAFRVIYVHTKRQGGH